MLNNVFIGTSGWSYSHWKTQFYKTTPKKDWLSYYSQKFNSVEINSTFYRLQREETFEKWALTTPDDFVFSIKANRYLTHTKKLKDPDSSINLEMEHAKELGDKLAVVLWQLPASFKINIQRLENFIHALKQWQDVRHTIEFRHTSWFEVVVKQLLSENKIAICQSDAKSWPMWSEVNTDFVYIRLHGHTETYVSSYSNASLQSWAEKIRHWQGEGKAVYVYFDNDAYAHAPKNALQLSRLLME